MQKINTIQDRLKTTYSDEYIKEALANLGQRLGANGDSVSQGSFKLSDIDERFKDAEKYICVKYVPSDDKALFIIDSSDSAASILEYGNSDLGTELLYVEYPIGKLNNTVTYRNHNTYMFVGVSYENDEIYAIDFINDTLGYIPFDTCIISLSNGKLTALRKQGSFLYKDLKDSDSKINEIYDTVSECRSVQEIYNVLNLGSTQEMNDSDLQKIEYVNEILPYKVFENYSIKTFYNPNAEISDNKKNIMMKLVFESVKAVYTNESSSATSIYDGNKDFDTYWYKDAEFSYFMNENTSLPYNGKFNVVDCNISYMNNDIEADKNVLFKYFTANNKYSFIYHSYSFNLQYIDTIILDDYKIESIETLPYINIDSDGNNFVWYINGKETSIKATGKDAGNPNIMMIAYVKNSDSISKSVLHTYSDEYFTYEIVESALNDEPYSRNFKYSLEGNNLSNASSTNYEFEIDLPNLNVLISKHEGIAANTVLMTFVDIGISENKVDGLTLKERILGSESNETTYITVFWHIENNNGIYDWKPILNPALSKNQDDENVNEGPVLDLGAMMGAKDIVSYFINSNYNPDSYLHSWIVFDLVNTVLKQSENVLDGIEKAFYPVIKIDSKDYYEPKAGTYNNSMNFVPKVVPKDSVKFNNANNTINDIADMEMQNKHFSIREENEYIQLENDDYVPNADDSNSYPMFDMREMLMTNITALNRINIVGCSNNSMMNAYIENDDKHLKLGTSSNNKNMQLNDTLTDSYNEFDVFTDFVVDMPTVFNKTLAFKYSADTAYYIMPVTLTSVKDEQDELDYSILSYITSEPKDCSSVYMGSKTIYNLEFDLKKYLEEIYKIEVNENENKYSTIPIENIDNINPETSGATICFVINFAIKEEKDNTKKIVYAGQMKDNYNALS